MVKFGDGSPVIPVGTAPSSPAAPREVEEPRLQRHVGSEKCDAARKPQSSHFSLVPIIGADCAVKLKIRAGACTALQRSHSRVFSVHRGLNIHVPLCE